LRALEGEYPEPLTCTVLYLDADTGRLQAYDEITLGGLGETEVTIQRRTAPLPDGGTDGDRSPSDGLPAPVPPTE
jgi:hypothetical protein